MISEDYDIIRAAVDAGHPWSIQAFAILEAQAVVAAVAEEEAEAAAQAR